MGLAKTIDRKLTFDHILLCYLDFFKKSMCLCISDIKSLQKNKSTLHKIHSSLYRFISISFLHLCLSSYLFYTKI